MHPPIEAWDVVDAFTRAYIMLAIRVMKASREAGIRFTPDDLVDDVQGLREQLPESATAGAGFVLDALVNGAKQFSENITEADAPSLTLVPDDDE